MRELDNFTKGELFLLKFQGFTYLNTRIGIIFGSQMWLKNLAKLPIRFASTQNEYSLPANIDKSNKSENFKLSIDY